MKELNDKDKTMLDNAVIERVDMGVWDVDFVHNALRESGWNITETARVLNRARDPITGERIAVGTVKRQNVSQFMERHGMSLDDTYEADNERKLMNTRRRANEANRANRALHNRVNYLEELAEGRARFIGMLEEATTVDPSLKLTKIKPPSFGVTQNAETHRVTIECIVSDWQIGKLGYRYNTEVALRRMEAYGQELVRYVNSFLNRSDATVERVVIVLLGDMIESHQKHDINSAKSTDSYTSQQLADAMVGLHRSLLMPFKDMPSIKLDVICITGNHDHDGRGMIQYEAGNAHLSYTLYNNLQYVSEFTVPHANFYIPKGCFHVAEIYGFNILYEHGVGVQANINAMSKHRVKRMDQLNKPLHYFRMGDKHNLSLFNSGQYLVNGAFFSTDKAGIEYSAIAGYDNVASQFMCAHTSNSDPSGDTFSVFDYNIVTLEGK